MIPEGTTVVYLSDLTILLQWNPLPHPLYLMLRPFLTDQTVQIGDPWDAEGVVVNPDVEGLDWEAAREIALSQKMPARGYCLRIFERKGGRWVRVQGKGEE